MELMIKFHVLATIKPMPIIPKEIPKLAQPITHAKKKSVFRVIASVPFLIKI